MNPPRKIDMVFYRSARGAEPVREWLAGMEVRKRREIGQDLQRVQYR